MRCPLKGEPRVQLDLTGARYRREDSSHIIGEITRGARENGVSVSSPCQRALRISRYCEIWMIQNIVGLCPESNPRAFGQLESLLKRWIKFRERWASEAVPSSRTELTRRRQSECTRIKPA
jgi:hypothetical protein